MNNPIIMGALAGGAFVFWWFRGGGSSRGADPGQHGDRDEHPDQPSAHRGEHGADDRPQQRGLARAGGPGNQDVGAVRPDPP